jgi:predicted MFS family arabinose efflux permease
MMGVLTAGSATGQLIILLPVAAMAENIGWRPASLDIASAALIVVPSSGDSSATIPRTVAFCHTGRTRTRIGRRCAQQAERAPAPWTDSPTQRGQRAFWALAIAFAICGATTNGLIGIHFIPSAHDHGMSTTAAAGLLAAVSVFDIAGTIASGWLTDKFDSRKLLVAYYAFRGVSLLLLPWLLSEHVHPSMIVFVIIYGLDWVAIVPPTAALRRDIFGDRGTIVFGWVFASHQIGAAAAAFSAGVIRDIFGTYTYTYAWRGGAAICVIAALLSIMAKQPRLGIRKALAVAREMTEADLV